MGDRFLGASMFALVGVMAIAALASPQMVIDLPKLQVAPFRVGGPPAMAEVPVCACPTQCEAAWSTATASIEELSGMRLRLASPSLLETYVPTGAGLFGGRVTRQPVGSGAYAIHVSFDSWAPGQNTEARRRLALLNDQLRSAIAAASCGT